MVISFLEKIMPLVIIATLLAVARAEAQPVYSDIYQSETYSVSE